MRWTRFHEFNEMVSVGTYVAQSSPAPMRWTLFRVGQLTDEMTKEVLPTFLGSGQDEIKISRSSVADWVLVESTSDADTWQNSAPYICNSS